MRVLMVSDMFPPVRGGLEFHVDGLATELAERGHEVHVATLTRNPTPTSGAVTVHTIPSSVWLLPHVDHDRPFHPPLPDPVAAGHLRRLVGALRPDIVHGHNWLATSVPHGSSDPPLVYTAHDYGLICQLRTLLNARGDNCAGPGPRKCLHCASQVHGWARTLALTPTTAVGRSRLRPDLVIAVSRHVASMLSSYLTAEVRVVPNFFAPGVEPRLPSGLPGRFAMYAGDPGRHKGVLDLLDLWRHEPPDISLVLAVTQPFDEPLPAGVVVTMMSRAEVRGALAMAEVALVPSRWQDPCPTVALEALASGTPVIASSVGGLKDIVRHGVDGYLVSPGSRSSLGERISHLIGDPAARAEMSASARKRSVDFSVSRVADAVVEAYSDTIEARAAAR